MRTSSSKQKIRTEKKKKKLAALANLVKLNDKDRQEIMAEKQELPHGVSKQNVDDNDDDGFIKVRQ